MNFHPEYSKISPLSASKGYIREKGDVKKGEQGSQILWRAATRNSSSRADLLALEKRYSRDWYISTQICTDQKEVIIFLNFSICHMAIKISKIVTKFKGNKKWCFSLFQNMKILVLYDTGKVKSINSFQNWSEEHIYLYYFFQLSSGLRSS